MALLLGPQYTSSVFADLTLAGIISSNGLLGNAVCVFDAADSASYSGSGQNYNDTSGNANNLYLGAGSGSEASDPTFVGTAGGLSSGEYFSHDGGDFCRLQAGANPTAINAIHKNNAVFTVFGVAWLPTGGGSSTNPLFGTEGGSVTGGFFHSMTNGSGTHSFLVRNSGGNALAVTSDASVALNQWNAFAVSIDEATGAGGGFLWKNGAYDQVGSSDTFNATYSSPVATDAPYVLELGARGNGSLPLVNTSRIACAAIFNAALSKAQLDAIWSDLNGARAYI